MYFDAHSDIWTDVTVKREHGEKNVLKNHHLDRLRAGQVEGSIFVIWVERPDIQDYAVRTAQIKQAILDETAECDEVQIVHTVAEMKQAPVNFTSGSVLKVWLLLAMMYLRLTNITISDAATAC